MKKKPQIHPNIVLQRNPNQLFSMIDDEVVMLNIKHEEYLNLNSQASYIWLQLESPKTFRNLVDQLLENFDTEEQECIEDTKVFITDFIEKDIIRIMNETV